VPGYEGGIKPDRQPCHYLREAKIKKCKWKKAGCKIHNSALYPKECKEFELWGPCPIGQKVWKKRKLFFLFYLLRKILS